MADDSGTTSGDELRLEPVQVGTRTRRRALWGVLAVVAVVAGGLVVASGGDEGSGPRLPVALGASREMAATAGAADMSLAWVTYVAGEGLPALGGEGTAYRLSGTVDEARVRDLAAALGLDGDLTHEDGYWHVAAGAAVLEVYEAGGSWWFSAAAGEVVEPDAAVSDSATGSGSRGSASATASASGTASASPACEPGPATDCTFVDLGAPAPDTTAPCAPDDASCTVLTTIDCGAPQVDCTAPPPLEPTPPADLPTEGAARQIALDLLAAAGMDVDGAKVTVDGPYDAWYVTVEPQIDGVAVSGWGASVGVGSEGAVTSASGVIGTPERVGDYPLVDTLAAIDRLNEQQGQYGGPVPAIATDAVTSEANETTADAPVPTAACGSDDQSCTVMSTRLSVGDEQPTTTTYVSSCKVQLDGSELCEGHGSSSAGGGSEPGVCYQAMPPVGDEAATETTVAGSECVIEPMPVPVPQPAPTEVVLTDAERVLVLLGAVDGSGDAYLVPGYRFSNEDGVIVEVAAVADDSLAPTTIPETTVFETTVPEVTEPPAPTTGDPVVLEPGQTPEIGVGYYVADVNTHCGTFVFADQWWATDAQTPLDWSTPTEGGTFTLSTSDEGTFVGDAAGTKTATFTARGPASERPGCS
jgi:hypothetical protein